MSESETVEINISVTVSKKDGETLNDAKIVANPFGSDCLFLGQGNALIQVYLADIIEKVEQHAKES